METGYEVVMNITEEGVVVEFNKDAELIAITTKVEDFLMARRIIISEYLTAKRNNEIHGLPIPRELEKLREIYETAFNRLADAEAQRDISNLTWEV